MGKAQDLLFHRERKEMRSSGLLRPKLGDLLTASIHTWPSGLSGQTLVLRNSVPNSCFLLEVFLVLCAFSVLHFINVDLHY